MGRKPDECWAYGDKLDGHKFKCNFCHTTFSGGATRLKSHLAGIKGRDIVICNKVKREVREEAFSAIKGSNKKARRSNGSSSAEDLQQSSGLNLLKEKNKDEVDDLLLKFFISNNIARDVIETPNFREFVRSVAAFGPDYEIPSSLIWKRKAIPDCMTKVDEYIEDTKKIRVTAGCSLMFDGKEEDIGPQHVQLMTKDGIEQLLEAIYECKQGFEVIDDVKRIVKYMYEHPSVLSLMRKYTNNRDLKHPCITKYVSDFEMLQSLLDVEKGLELMIASPEWGGLDCNKGEMAKKVTSIIQNPNFWSQGGELLQVLEPLVQVVR